MEKSLLQTVLPMGTPPIPHSGLEGAWHPPELPFSTAGPGATLG